MTKSPSPHVGSVHKDSPAGCRRSGAGVIWPSLPRACYAVSLTLIVPSTPSWTVKGSATVIAIGVGRHGVGRDNGPRGASVGGAAGVSVHAART
jgi:hypothetical protein